MVRHIRRIRMGEFLAAGIKECKQKEDLFPGLVPALARV